MKMNRLGSGHYDSVHKDMDVPNEFCSFLFHFRAVPGDAGVYDYF